MPFPQKPQLAYSYTGFQQEAQVAPFPGQPLDNDLAELKRSIDETIDAVKDVRRSDGKLKNGVVTRDSLSPEVEDLAGASAYGVALANGFVGTEEEWLESLVGAPGPQGSPGAQGDPGMPGAQGDQGDPGTPGAAATIAVGTVTTGAPGTDVIIANAGTSSAAIFDITIPRGATGASGAGTGDMVAATYDPNAVGGNAFDMANMVENTNAKVMTAAERAVVADAMTKAGAQTVTGLKTFSTASAGVQVMEAVSTASGAAGGPFIYVRRDKSGAGSADDRLGAVVYLGKDSSGAAATYASVRTQILDPTPGSVDGSIQIVPTVNGGGVQAAAFHAGLTMGTATGGDMGAGTVNAVGYYLNGTALASGLFGVTPGATGLAILADTSGAAVRAEIGLGTAAVKNTGTSGDAVPLLNAGNTFSAAQAAAPVALTDGATITPNLTLSNLLTITLGGNRTLANPSAKTIGQEVMIVVRQDGTGGRTLAFGTQYKFPGGLDPVLSTAANAIDVIAGVVVSSTEILCNSSKGFA